MSNSISQLTPSQALQQAVKASTLLLAALNQAIQLPLVEAAEPKAAKPVANKDAELDKATAAKVVDKISLGNINLTLAELAEIDLINPQIEKLQIVRDELLHQAFSEPWQEAQVAAHQASFEALETLDKQLQNLALELRTNLHQLRTENQQGRRAVSAYGQAKGQFSR
ncbi:MAG: hypothetical protein GX029_00975 [Pseudomonadaceae bacterium]|nr:hypothetical protein [Pseudomonadaceae bacterium]